MTMAGAGARAPSGRVEPGFLVSTGRTRTGPSPTFTAGRVLSVPPFPVGRSRRSPPGLGLRSGLRSANVEFILLPMTLPASAEPELESRQVRRRVRERLLSEIPATYNPWLHLAATTGIGLVLLAAGTLGIHRPRLPELLTVPFVFLLANGFEWRAHRDILHRARRPLEVLYRKHTPEHHVVYVDGDMAVRDWRELRLVLIPSSGVLAIVVALAPFAALMGVLVSANAGWLILLTGGLYMVGYELSHLSYHLPPESFIGRLALVRALRAHHERHHDPRLMQRWNFNVTLPLFDWLHGTIAPARTDVARESAGATPLGTTRGR